VTSDAVYRCSRSKADFSKEMGMQRKKIILQMIARGALWGVMAGVLVGIILGLPIFVIGALVGMVIGGFVGLCVGAMAGLLAGIITSVFHIPPKHMRQYRLLLAATCALFAALCTFLASQLYFTPISDTARIYLHVLLPTLAALLAILISQRLANWYIHAEQVSSS
jgi:hypothetical protein